MKPAPTLADSLIREWSRPDYRRIDPNNYLATHIAQARKFVLDASMSAFMADLWPPPYVSPPPNAPAHTPREQPRAGRGRAQKAGPRFFSPPHRPVKRMDRVNDKREHHDAAVKEAYTPGDRRFAPEAVAGFTFRLVADAATQRWRRRSTSESIAPRMTVGSK